MRRDDAEVVFRTGLLHEADMVADALERALVPYYRQEESASGLTFAMPVAPAPGPGAAWLILVPRSRSGQARKVIRGLRVSNDPSPGFFGFRPRPEVKQFYRQYAWFFVAAFIAMLVWNIIQLFRR